MGGKRTKEQRQQDWIKYKAKYPDVNRKKYAKRKLVDPVGLKAKWARWHANNTVKRREYQWRTQGINCTQKLYDEILSFQGGTCAICGRPPGRRKLAVDHSHSTGKVRGLLCGPCNVSLPYWLDQPELVSRLVAYLVSTADYNS